MIPYSKHREQDVLPLHLDLVPLIQEQLSHLHNGDPLFPFLEQRKTARMMQVDLEAAGIPYQDADGLYADFHALRHSFITRAWESGESPDVVMSLAWHRSLQIPDDAACHPDACHIAAAWPLLAPHIREAILTLVDASLSERRPS